MAIGAGGIGRVDRVANFRKHQRAIIDVAGIGGIWRVEVRRLQRICQRAGFALADRRKNGPAMRAAVPRDRSAGPSCGLTLITSSRVGRSGSRCRNVRLLLHGFFRQWVFRQWVFRGRRGEFTDLLSIRTTRIQEERPLILLSTCSCGSLIFERSPMFSAPAQPCTQTHFISGLTSQCPLGRTPPQGPLRRVLGQFIGQDIPVEDSAH